MPTKKELAEKTMAILSNFNSILFELMDIIHTKLLNETDKEKLDKYKNDADALLDKLRELKIEAKKIGIKTAKIPKISPSIFKSNKK